LGRRLSRPETTRVVLVWLGIAVLAAIWLSGTARSLLLQPYVLSALIFTLVGLIIVPARLWPLAFLVASGALVAARLATRLKEMAVSLPITYVDVASTLQEPEIVLHAIGIHAPVEWLLIASVVVLAAIFFIGMRLAPRTVLTRSAMLVVETVALIAVALPALARAGDYLNETVTTRFSYDALQIWEPGGQRLLIRHMGTLEYLAFTRAVGMRGWKAASHGPVRPIPVQAAANAAARYVSPSADRTLPNIVVLHAESSFDPNLIFRLTKPVDSPLWTPVPLTKSLGDLRVNIVGGGTQVTQFELFTGADTRQFGYWGFYTHLTLAPKLRDAFPLYLAARGYRTIASYPVNGDWLGAGEAFKHYGFHRVIFANEMHLRGDWSETDTDLVGRAIERGALKPAREPFFTFLSTLENHGPHPCKHFTSRSQFVTSFEGNASFAQDCSLNEYLRRARSTTAAMKMVIDSLLQAQKTTGRPFVLLIYGDHQPWSFTDGDYTVAGGVANAHDTASFARFRRGPNQRITFYHVISSVPDTVPRGFAKPIPVTLLPSLLSAYVASRVGDLYMPENFYAFDQCGADYRAANCRLRDDADAWAQQRLFKQQ
jgi:phosphoglycerol transferase MdoB-like AlkP superfamily enzyme